MSDLREGPERLTNPDDVGGQSQYRMVYELVEAMESDCFEAGMTEAETREVTVLSLEQLSRIALSMRDSVARGVTL